MKQEAKARRAISFFDGQNLYRHAKTAFGHYHPNYDPQKLHAAVCREIGLRPGPVRFYTGVPTRNENEPWHDYWQRRLRRMKREHIRVTDMPLRYHREEVVALDGASLTLPDGNTVPLPDGTSVILPRDSDPALLADWKRTRSTPREKSIDVRIALDMVRLARERRYDAAILFSQDQDFAPAVQEVKAIAQQQKRWIQLVCAFPDDPRASSRKGIRGCDWFRMEQALYDRCLDPKDYRF